MADYGSVFGLLGQGVTPLIGPQQFLGMEAARQEMQARQLAIAQTQREQAGQHALATALQGAQGIDDVSNRLIGMGYGDLVPHIRQAWGQADKAAADAADAKAKASIAEADYLGGLGAQVKAAGFQPWAVNLALDHADAAGHDTSPIRAVIQQHPDQLPQFVESLIAASPAQRELQTKESAAASGAQNAATTAKRLDLEAPGLTAASAIQSQVAAGTVGGLTPAQQVQAAAEKETARHNRAAEGLERQKLANDQADAPQFTDDGLNVAALNYKKTGQFPPMGLSKDAANVRAQIVNRAADPNLEAKVDIAANRANYRADSGSLAGLQKQRDAIGAFEQTAGKNLDLFLEQAGKVVDTGSPLANSMARQVSGKMLGSPDQAAYDAARQVAINEIAKITNGGGLSGVLSDSARHEVAGFNPANATLAQTVRVARVLRQDMANRTLALDSAIGGVKGRIGGGAPAPAAGGGMVLMRAPDGTTKTVSADQVSHYLALGAVVVQ